MTGIQPISPERLPRIVHQGRLVITTELLAQLYGTEVANIQANHSRNRARFVEGKHFYKVAGKDLDDLRLTLGKSQIAAKARSLILWTERGAARHAKMVETDQAWDVFEKLEDSYFSQRDRLANMGERAPLHHDAIDIAANTGTPLPKVYRTLNLWAGVNRLSNMTVSKVSETVGFSGRWKVNIQTAADIQRIEAHSIALYGESRQLPLLATEGAK